MDEYCKRSCQIPAFGNRENANENARQAGLVPYSCSSHGGESNLYLRGEDDLYAVDFKKPVRKETRNRETRMRKQGKVYHVTEHSRRKTLDVNDAVVRKAPLPTRLPKPVDEDLYKISPQLLRKTKRKKMLGFISKCLLPTACV